jgi:hypothetical protein
VRRVAYAVIVREPLTDAQMDYRTGFIVILSHAVGCQLAGRCGNVKNNQDATTAVLLVKRTRPAEESFGTPVLYELDLMRRDCHLRGVDGIVCTASFVRHAFAFPCQCRVFSQSQGEEGPTFLILFFFSICTCQTLEAGQNLPKPPELPG